MNTLTVSDVYVGLFSNYLEQLKADRPELNLDEIIIPTTLETGSECVTLDALENLVKSIVKLTRNNALGLDVGEKIHPSDYGVFGYAVMNCSTLLQALHLMASHVTLLNQSFSIKLRAIKDETNVVLKSHSNDIVGSILVELQMASICHMASFLAGSYHQDAIRMTEIHFKHSPTAEISRYQQIFSCPVLFNQEHNKIVVANTILSKPVRSASPKLLLVLQKKMKRLQDEMDHSISLGQRVCDFIEDYVETNGVPSAAVVAKHFNMSVSTLKKHLNQESLNYTNICDDVRRNIAVKKVSCSSDQLKSISDYLDFSNTSAFNRAFRRWTEMTPAEYRRKHFKPDASMATGNDENYYKRTNVA